MSFLLGSSKAQDRGIVQPFAGKGSMPSGDLSEYKSVCVPNF